MYFHLLSTLLLDERASYTGSKVALGVSKQIIKEKDFKNWKYEKKGFNFSKF